MKNWVTEKSNDSSLASKYCCRKMEFDETTELQILIVKNFIESSERKECQYFKFRKTQVRETRLS